MIRLTDPDHHSPGCEDKCAHNECDSVPIFDVSALTDDDFDYEDDDEVKAIPVYHACLEHYPSLVRIHCYEIGNTLLNPEDEEK